MRSCLSSGMFGLINHKNNVFPSFQRFVNNIERALEDAKEKCKKQRAVASKLTDNKKPSDGPYKKQFDDLPDTIDALVDHMNEIQGQMECIRNYSREVSGPI